MDSNLKLLYKKIKDNLVILALIPSLLGGIWQLVKLAEISPNMIRFFSISQLISDGLLILIFVMISLIPILIISLSNYHSENNFFSAKTPYDKIFRVLIPIPVYYLFFDYVFNNSLDSIYNLIKFLSGFSLILALIYILFKIIFNDIFGNFLPLTIIFLINIGISFYTFNKIDKNDKSVANFKNLILKIKHENFNIKNPKILYFNDKYIFIEVIKNKKQEIIIEKFDSLFEKEKI